MALRGGWREMVETACKARARHLCVQLADKYEEEINKVENNKNGNKINNDNIIIIVMIIIIIINFYKCLVNIIHPSKLTHQPTPTLTQTNQPTLSHPPSVEGGLGRGKTGCLGGEEGGQRGADKPQGSLLKRRICPHSGDLFNPPTTLSFHSFP